MKKTVLCVVAGVLIFLVGVVTGLGIWGIYLKRNAGYVYSSKVNTEISPKQIENTISLKPNQIIYGEVFSKNGNKIVLRTQLINPLDTKDIKTLPVNVEIGQNDEIVRLKQSSPDKPLETIKQSIGDIKVGDYVTLKVLTDKKIIYLPAQ